MNLGPIMGKLPPATGRSVIIEKDQNVADIISLMTFVHKKNVATYDKIGLSFWTGDIYETCGNLWKFCKNNIAYDIETDKKQTVRTPQRILSERSGDCKHYASFIGGCLGAIERAGYPVSWCYRFASYKIFDATPGHVFVVVFDQGEEIWIDPVLDHFDEHRMYVNAIDKKIKTVGTVGCDCSNKVGLGKIGASYSMKNRANAAWGYGNYIGDLKTDFQIGGGAVLAVSPYLATIPIIGWIGGAVLAAVGGIMELVGGLMKDYKTTSQVRWLTQLYQYYVLSQAQVKGSQEVNENYTLNSQAWFYAVLGVPIYDRYRFNSIWNKSHPQPLTKAQAVAEYLNYPDTKKVDPAAAAHAYDIAQTMFSSDPPGGWADMTAANVMAPTPTPQTSNVQVFSPVPGSNVSDTAAPLVSAQPYTSLPPILPPSLASIPTWVWIAGGGVLLLLITKKR
jgi:hypothetical protein